MNKKGFTLIELLAVILILGIIALIAIPTVNNILKEARRGAFSSTLNNINKAIEEKCTLEQIKNQEITTSYTITDGVITPSLDIKGDLPDGTINVNSNCEVSFTLADNNFTGSKDFTGEIEITDGSSLVSKYKEELLNGADPVIAGGLVPVTIESNGTVKKANIKNKWYSYEEKTWANAVILFGEDTYSAGDTIPENAIKQYYVWIPRYKYKLWNVNSEELYPNGTSSESPIDIVFENKNKAVSNGDENGEWLTHPAFTSFNTNGIWVGKFETSYNEETFTDNSLFLTSNPNTSVATDGTNIIIKPNVRSLTNKTPIDFYTMTREVNSTLNSHMMKNSEWGATAYLTYSIYGKCTGSTCEEVYINNVNTGYFNKTTAFSGQWDYGATITGCSGNSASASINSNNNTCESGYAWNEESNKASTTGNISGIYDMSGGGWEYMMSVVSNDPSGAGIPNSSDIKYYELYEENTGKLGDATKEIIYISDSLWYGDFANFPSLTYPWVFRGGFFGFGDSAGVLSFYRSIGPASSNHSFRLVLAY